MVWCLSLDSFDLQRNLASFLAASALRPIQCWWLGILTYCIRLSPPVASPLPILQNLCKSRILILFVLSHRLICPSIHLSIMISGLLAREDKCCSSREEGRRSLSILSSALSVCAPHTEGRELCCVPGILIPRASLLLVNGFHSCASVTISRPWTWVNSYKCVKRSPTKCMPQSWSSKPAPLLSTFQPHRF